MSVGAVVLAAGAGRRFGSLKQLSLYRGRPLVAHVADRVWSWGVTPVVVVLGCRAAEVRTALADPRFEVAENRDWESGMASSLQVGIAALAGRDVDAAFVAMGDQPEIDAAVPGELMRRFADSRRAYAPSYRGTLSNPVLFGRSVWPALMALDGDHGARRLLTAGPDWLVTIPFDLAPPGDVTVPADLPPD